MYVQDGMFAFRYKMKLLVEHCFCISRHLQDEIKTQLPKCNAKVKKCTPEYWNLCEDKYI